MESDAPMVKAGIGPDGTDRGNNWRRFRQNWSRNNWWRFRQNWLRKQLVAVPAELVAETIGGGSGRTSCGNNWWRFRQNWLRKQLVAIPTELVAETLVAVQYLPTLFNDHTETFAIDVIFFLCKIYF
jgi:hypothetical protein